jgi:hypothetical protein
MVKQINRQLVADHEDKQEQERLNNQVCINAIQRNFGGLLDQTIVLNIFKKYAK